MNEASKHLCEMAMFAAWRADWGEALALLDYALQQPLPPKAWAAIQRARLQVLRLA